METTIPVTRTKIIIPRRRADILSRRRLLSKLEELAENLLIIVAAPAGYGKTSLMVDFVHQSAMPVCWLSLDNLDSDPQRFMAHFISAIKVVFPNFGKTCLPALQGMPQDRLNLDALVSLTVNDAFDSISEHFLIVVDDYHLVEDNRDINYFVNRFLLQVDENCHMIISSRRLLPLPDMPLLVARSLVGGLGFEDLAFQPEEIQNLYLQNHKLTLSPKEADELATLTEGWITGLILSTQVSNGRVTTRFQARHVSGVGLYDYLAQQVLEHQSDELKQFLYRTSLLEEFDAEICEEVIGSALNIKADWQALMEGVQRNNLFVLPVVEEKIWLRYHHLFRDFLQGRILRDYPDEARAIQIRLAEYYQQIGDWERAYQVLEKIGNNEYIAKMIEAAGPMLVAHGRLITLQNWLERLPAILVEKSASLVSIQGVARVMLGDSKGGVELFNQALTLLDQADQLTLRCHTYVRRSGAYRMIGEYQKALEDAEEALRLTRGRPELDPIQAGAQHSKGMTLYYLGNLNDALKWLEQAKVSFLEINDEEAAYKVAMEIAMVSRYLGQFSTAEQIYKEVLFYYQNTGNIVWQANLLNNLGVLHSLAGDYETALSELERSIQYAKMGGYVRLEAYALTSLGDLFKDIRAYREANEAYDKARTAATQVNDQFLGFYLMLIESDLALQRGHIKKAEDALEKARVMAKEAGSRYEENLCLLLAGRIGYAKADYGAALGELLQAMQYFTREGHHVEAVRCRFLVTCAHFLLNQMNPAQEELNRLLPLIRGQELTNVVASAGEPLAGLVQKEVLPQDVLIELVPLKQLVELHEQKLPSVRKLLRRQSGIIPLSPPELSILTLGKTQISIGDHVITGLEWRQQSSRDLLLLLLLHPEGLTKEEVGAYFWPDISPAELKLRFKNTIYRLRHAAGKDVILFVDDIYSFNHGMDYEADFETFNREIKQAGLARKPEHQLGHYRAAIQLYQGEFLPDLAEEWVIPERERLREKFSSALVRTIELCLELSQPGEALVYAQRYFRDEPTNEHIHQLVMRIYAGMGNIGAVVRQYEQLVQVLEDDLGTKPSHQTEALFELLTRERKRF